MIEIKDNIDAPKISKLWSNEKRYYNFPTSGAIMDGTKKRGVRHEN